jgi:hypothetical protein
MGGTAKPVILSEAKDHLATLDPLEKILRFAQDDTWLTLAMLFTLSRPVQNQAAPRI